MEEAQGTRGSANGGKHGCILPEPRSNGIPGPIPAQGDFLDPRWRRYSGPRSEVIPFPRPAWVLDRHWEAYRKAAVRESTYTITLTVKPTLASLRRYVRHLQAEDAAQAIAAAFAPPSVPEAPEPIEDHVLLRGLSVKELAQHERYRAMGLEPWIWTAPRGTNIVLLNEYRKLFALWQRSRKAKLV